MKMPEENITSVMFSLPIGLFVCMQKKISKMFWMDFAQFFTEPVYSDLVSLSLLLYSFLSLVCGDI